MSEKYREMWEVLKERLIIERLSLARNLSTESGKGACAWNNTVIQWMNEIEQLRDNQQEPR